MSFQTIEQVREKSVHTLSLAVGGPPKSGKTQFCLTAPSKKCNGKEGIYVHVFDPGSLPTLVKSARKGIKVAYYLDEVKSTLDAGRTDTEAIKTSAKKLLTKFQTDFYKESIVKGRSVIIDDGTVLWDIIRLAEFGKLEQVPQLMYVHANKTYRDITLAAFEANVNLLMPHKVKEIWASLKNSEGRDLKDSKTGKTVREATGRFELAGCDSALYYVQTVGFTSMSRCSCLRWHGGPCTKGMCECKHPCEADGEFHMRIEQNGPDPSCIGLDFSAGDLTFPQVASMLIPGTDTAYWE